MINVGMNAVILDLGEYNKMQKMIRDMEAKIKKYESSIKLVKDYKGGPQVDMDVKLFADTIEQKFGESEFAGKYKIASKDQWWSTTYNGYGIFEEVPAQDPKESVEDKEEVMTVEDFDKFMEEVGPDNDVEVVKKDV